MIDYRIDEMPLEELTFTTAEEAAPYDAWFRAKVEKAIRSTKPRIPHDQAMARVRAIIQKRLDARQLYP